MTRHFPNHRLVNGASLPVRLLRMFATATMLAATLLAGTVATQADSEAVRLQSMLLVLGHSPGTIDGSTGPATRNATAAFLAQQGLDPGLSGEPLFAALRAGIDRRIAELQAEQDGTFALSPTGFTDLEFIQPIRGENLLAAGKCEGIHMFRLDTLEPLGVVNSSFCLKVLGAVESRNAVVVTGAGGAIMLQDVRTSQMMEGLRLGSNDLISAGAVHEASGTIVFTSTYGNVMRVLSMVAPYEERTLVGTVPSDVFDVAVSASGNFAVSSEAEQVQIWDLAAGRSVRSYPDALVGAMSTTQDVVALLVAPEGGLARVELRTLADDTLVAESPSFPLGARYTQDMSYGGTLFLDFADGGNSVVLFGGQGESASTDLLKWTTSGATIESIPLPFSSEGYAAVDAAENRLLIADRGGVRAIDLSGDNPVLSRDIRPGVETTAAAVSLDGGQIAVTGILPDADGKSPYYSELGLFLIDTATGAVDHRPLHWQIYSSLCIGGCAMARQVKYLPGGDRVLVADDGTIKVITLSTGAIQTIVADNTYETIFGGLALSPDGTQLAVGRESGVTLMSTADWSIQRTIDREFNHVDGMAMQYVDVGANLIVGTSGLIEVFSVESGQRLQTIPFELNTKGQHYTLAPNYVTRLPGSAERYLVGGNAIYGIGKIWIYESGSFRDMSAKADTILRSGNSAYVTALGEASFAYDDGNTVIGTDTDESGQFLLTRHAGSVAGILHLPDGRLVSIGTSGDVIFLQPDLDSRTTAELVRTQLFGREDWVSHTAEGFFVSSGIGDKQLLIRSGREDVSAIETFYDSLYRPDLVASKLTGDLDGLVVAAAAQVNLGALIDSGAAPIVALVGIADDTVVDAESIAVEATLTDRGGGIGRIEWRVNGITLGIEARGFDRLSTETQSPISPSVTVRQTLSLDPGDNLIEILAYNERGLVASDPAAVTVKWDGASAMTPPKLHVLSIGVDDYYDSRLQLNFATSDALAVAEAFRQAGKDLYESVEVTTVLDAEVTADNLGKVFTDLGSKVRPRDVFVLFMAGHGKTQDGRYYFLPADFRYADETSIASGGIDQDQFQQWLALIPARKSMLLYDTCDSGSLTSGLASRGLEEVAALARLTRAMGRTILSASTDNAPALEGYNGHGVFTYALLQALGEGDANGDGDIEITELAGSIDRLVPEISYAAFNLRQVPQMSIVGSSFPVVKSVAVLSATPTVVDRQASHVLITETPISETASTAPPNAPLLPAGTLVRVLSEEEAWSVIARDGTPIGYVPSSSMAPLN